MRGSCVDCIGDGGGIEAFSSPIMPMMREPGVKTDPRADGLAPFPRVRHCIPGGF